MFAQHIIADAPLGVIIRFSDGTSRPPERFRRKLSDWITRNDKGRLIRKDPAFDRGSYHYSGGFGLLIGDYGLNEVGAVRFTRHFDVGCQLKFEIIEVPPPGSVRILVPSGETEELVHLAVDLAAAQTLIMKQGFGKARLETVNDLPAGPLRYRQ